MTIPTSSDLALYRSRPHLAKTFLSLYNPSTILSAQISGSFNYTNMTLGYDNVTSGSYSGIKSGMTMYVGTTPNGYDVGKVRVKGATAAQIQVAENRHIAWADNQYIHVVDFHELWPVFPRMLTNSGYTIWYKDFDIAYTNQNDVLGAWICMGPHNASFREAGHDRVYFTATGSVHAKAGVNLSYFWQFPGGSPSWYSGSVPGYVDYTTPGHYTAQLDVYGTNGSHDTAYRHISVYDRPGEGSATPILRWNLLSLGGSRSDGGWTARVRIWDDLSSVRDGTLCVLFTDSEYGGTKTDLGGNAQGRGATLFVGYVSAESIHYDFEKSYVDFDIKSITGLMKDFENFSTALNDSPNPQQWYEMNSLSIKRAVFHYMRWHTTLLDIADVEFRNFPVDPFIQYFDAAKTTLYDAINSFLQSACVSQAVSDRQGKIWVEYEAGIIPSVSGSLPQSIDLQRHDWKGEPYFPYRDNEKINYLEAGGIAYSGSVTGTNAAYLAGAPGAYVPRYGGGSQSVSGLALLSQEHLNALVGDLLAWRGSNISEVTYDLVGDYRFLDIAPQEQLYVSMNPLDTIKGLVWSRKPFVVQRMDGNHDSERASLGWGISLKEITNGALGETIPIPPVPPDEEWPDLPDIDLPDFPPIPWPPIPDIPTNTVFVYGVRDSTGEHALARSDDFDSPSPTWRNVRPVTCDGAAKDFCHDPWAYGSAGYMLTSTGLFRLYDLNTAFPKAEVLATPSAIQTTLRSLSGYAGLTIDGLMSVVASPVVPGRIFITLGATKADGTHHNVWIGHRDDYYSSTFTFVSVPYVFGDNYGWVKALETGKFNGDLLYVGVTLAAVNSEIVLRSTDGGNTFVAARSLAINGGAEPQRIHVPENPSAADQLVWVMGGRNSVEDAYIACSSNAGVSWATKTPAFIHGYGDGGGASIEVCNILSYYGDKDDIMATVVRSTWKRGKEATHLIKSVDGGSSWSLVKTFVHAGYSSPGVDRVSSLRRHPFDPNKLYAMGNSKDGYIMYSADGGVTWQEKLGNWFGVFGVYPCDNGKGDVGAIFPVF